SLISLSFRGGDKPFAEQVGEIVGLERAVLLRHQGLDGNAASVIAEQMMERAQERRFPVGSRSNQNEHALFGHRTGKTVADCAADKVDGRCFFIEDAADEIHPDWT